VGAKKKTSLLSGLLRGHIAHLERMALGSISSVFGTPSIPVSTGKKYGVL
jgi:hypothetical protein